MESLYLRRPIPASALSDDAVAQFAGADGLFKGRPPPVLASARELAQRARSGLGNQVHPALRASLSFDGRRPVWDARVFDVLGNATLGALSPPGYPHAITDILTALETVQRYTGFRSCGRLSSCLVVGSITPWVELALLRRASTVCRAVVTLDHNPPVLADGRFGDRLRTLAADAPPPAGRFDLIVSFSGLEHSGLTRYGDALDPNGDLTAAGQIAAMLARRGGCALLAMPISDNATDVVWPQHRLYGPQRYRRVTRHFADDALGFVWDGKVLSDPFHPSLVRAARATAADWQYQPVAMLVHDAA